MKSTYRGTHGLFFSFVLAALMALLPLSLSAQDGLQPQPAQDVSDDELEQFSTAITAVQGIQTQMQSDIDQIILQSTLSRERFLELLEASQSLGAGSLTDATESEQREFDALIVDISELQSNSQELMAQAVVDSGLELQRFNEILTALQSDPELMNRLIPYLQE